MNDESVVAAGVALRAAQQVVVISHVRPDGDAVGSVLGLGGVLKQAGKGVQMVLADGVPDNFLHLPGAEAVQTNIEPPWDLLVSLDCSDPRRFGPALAPSVVPDINMDHHVTNLNFGRVNLVDPTAVATAAMLAAILPEWGYPVNQPVASALLTGILTDTIGFRTSNMNPAALRLSANLMESGAPLPELYRVSLVERSYEATRLWGEGLANLQRRGRMVWTTITLDDRQKSEYPGLDDAELVNVLTEIKDHDIFIVFSEQPEGDVKVSWRASPGFDVSAIAFDLGGGGHPAAAGATIRGDLENVQRHVLEATERLAVVGEVEK